MKKLSIRKARIIASVCCTLVIAVAAFTCFYKEPVTSVVGGESYAPIYKGSEKSPQVALMFNVYENTKIVNGIIEILNDYGVKATFFVGGSWADDNNETLVRIIEEGHSLGNHGYFHKNHKKLSEAENYSEIKLNHDLVYAITGKQMNLFAPPSGSFSKTTLIVAEKLGYRTVMWSKDTIDWRDNDVNLIVKRATSVQNGDFVLMHPKPQTLKALPKILDFYKEKGVTPVTVDACI